MNRSHLELSHSAILLNLLPVKSQIENSVHLFSQKPDTRLQHIPAESTAQLPQPVNYWRWSSGAGRPAQSIRAAR